MKKKIIHFIFNLGRGGAETMMVRVLKELPEYENVVVTLFPLNHFGKELQCDKLISFQFTSLFQLPLGIFKLRKLIKKEKPAMVHSHLFWPTVIARLAVPKRIPLVTTIHTFIATSIEYSNWHIRFLDKLTYRIRKSSIIVVAKGALDEYFSFLKIKPWKSYLLYTFVDIQRFKPQQEAEQRTLGQGPVFKVVSVGALREYKNLPFFIDAFKLIKDLPVELHIYGSGSLRDELERQIAATGANIHLKGEVSNIEAILPQYDLYTMSSKGEGFSLSVLEAMASGLPLLLSDIVSFREQCEETAVYFNLDSPQDFVDKLQQLRNDKHRLTQLANNAKERAIKNFTLERHIEGLRNIYKEVLTSK